MALSSDFTHLHVHSEYSLLDGAGRVDDIVHAAYDHGMNSIAVTDHGNMYAAIKFYKAAIQKDIHPIIGLEAYFAKRGMLEKSTQEDRSPYHITLLAKNETGYKNLLELVTLSNTKGFYQKPRIDKELLFQFSEGLIVLSGCLAGQIPELILANNVDKAFGVAKEFKEKFGDDFYLEIMDNNLAEQKNINKYIIEASKKLGIKMAATNDAHYIERDDAKAQDVLLCIQTGKFIDDKDRMRFGSGEFYIKSAQEMYALFSGIEDACKNTSEIREKCRLKIEMGKMHLPEFNVAGELTPFEQLYELAYSGVKKRYGDNISKETRERLEHELKVIRQMGYAPFFLIVQDFTNYAKQNGIEVGPGRGSAAGSLVAYAIGITEVDPFKYGLIFERFLNIDRVTMPDIDIDFCYQRRPEIIDYVMKKYGHDHVAQIVTFGTMQARAVIRDVGRVLKIPLADVDRVAKMIPIGPDSTIDSALKNAKEFKQVYEKDLTIKNLIDTAKTLEGLVRHASVHAAGIVISEKPLTNYVPLQVSGEKQTITQYSMKDLEDIGLLKMDFLGLRNLTMIAYAARLINKKMENKLDIKHIPLDDKKTFELLCNGDTVGVFQLESQGMRSLIREVKPDRFEDLIALLALHRPGPLESGMVDDFVKRKNNLKKATYEIKELEPILKETYGVILYQEQVMRIAIDIAGFSPGEADILRHAMGKKKHKEMAKQREKFIEGAMKKGFNRKKVIELFDLCEKFAGYGFNKSHSASYSIISYQTAYLKANYPLEFMAALLTSVMGVPNKITFYIAECRKMNIPILLPDVNESDEDFTVVQNSIRFGLSAIKNVGINAVISIIDTRNKHGHFKSFEDFCGKVGQRVVNKKVVESLIKCGAFDFLGEKRAILLSHYEKISKDSNKNFVNFNKGQTMLFEEILNTEIPKTEAESAPDFEFSSEQLLRMEKELLGLYISDHPLHHLKDILKSNICTAVADVYERKEGDIIKIGGILSNSKKITTKRKEQMMIGDIEDLTGSIGVVIFPRAYEKYSSILSGDSPLLVKGKVDARSEDVKIICEEIGLLEKNSSKRRIHISIPKKADISSLSRIKDILIMFTGSEEVFFHLNGSTICAGDSFLVSICEPLIKQIENFLGDGCAWIDFANDKL